MPYLSPEQCRAARALLDWQQRDLVRESRVSKKTIADFERGKTTPQARTLDDLRQAFESAGVEFLDDVQGVGGLGVRMRAGFRPITRTISQGEDRVGNEASGLDTLGWDWDDYDATDALQPAQPLDWDDKTKAAQIKHWRARPEKWAALAEVSRQCLLRAMGVERL